MWEKKKSNQLEREKNLCSIACMDESIQQTTIFCLKVSTVLLYSNQTHISMGYNNLLSFACKRNKCLLHKKSFWKKKYIYLGISIYLYHCVYEVFIPTWIPFFRFLCKFKHFNTFYYHVFQDCVSIPFVVLKISFRISFYKVFWH